MIITVDEAVKYNPRTIGRPVSQTCTGLAGDLVSNQPLCTRSIGIHYVNTIFSKRLVCDLQAIGGPDWRVGVRIPFSKLLYVAAIGIHHKNVSSSCTI